MTVRGVVQTLGSKSVAQRVISTALLGAGESTVVGVPLNEDLEVYLRGVRQLGFCVDGDPPGPLTVHGIDGVFPSGVRHVDVGSNGTALRFLTALAALRDDETLINGASHRPVRPLVKALSDLGCDIECQGEGPPVRIQGGAIRGGRVVLQAAISSQFTSALMLVASALPEGLLIRLVGPIASRPYIDLTAAVLRAFGTRVNLSSREISIGAGSEVKSGKIEIESDASAAAFPLCAAAMTSGDVTVEGVGTRSLQGDRCIAQILHEMGCEVEEKERSIRVSGPPLRAISRNMEATPDLVPPVAVLAAFARGESVFSGISHLRHKECDRLAVLCEGMRSLGIRTEVRADLLRVVGSDGADLVAADLDPAGDHRMAMAFALLSLRVPGTRVLDPSCVNKSDPQFFTRLEGLLEERECTR